MIIHTEKRESPFAQIDKQLLEDPALTWKAKGLLCYLLSKPNKWRVMMIDLVRHGKGGIDAIRAAMNELRDAGYAELRACQDEKGRLTGKEWFVREQPHRDRGFPDVGETPTSGKTDSRETPTSGKSRPSNNDVKSKTDKQSKTQEPDLFADADGTPPTPPTPPEQPFAIFWRLYPKKVGKLDAQKAWKNRKCDTKADVILPALNEQRRAGMFNLAEPRFIPNPATWLNQGRWEDEIRTHENTKPTAARNPQSIHERQRNPDKCVAPADQVATIIDGQRNRRR